MKIKQQKIMSFIKAVCRLDIIVTVVLVVSLSSVSADTLVHNDETKKERNPITLSADGTIFPDSSFDLRLNLDLPFSGGEHFTIGGGYSTVPLEDDSIALRSASLGLHGNVFSSMIIGGGLEYWGNEDALTTHQLTIDLDVAIAAWQLRVHPRYRRISIYSDDLSPSSKATTRSRLDTNNMGLNIDISYYGFEDWSHRLHGNYQNYSEDMTIFDTEKYDQAYEQMIQDLKDLGLEDRQIDCLLNCAWETIVVAADRANLSAQSLENIRQLRQGVYRAANVLDKFSRGLSLSTRFEDYSAGYELGFYWGNWDMSLDLTHSRNAVTKTALNYFSGVLGYGQNNYYAGLGYSVLMDDISNWSLQLFLTVPIR